MDEETIRIYEDEGADYSIRRGVQHPDRVRAFAASVPEGGLRVDLGSGPGHHLPLLGDPSLAVDGAHAMLLATRSAAPDTPVVRADLLQLPFTTRSVGGVWASKAHQHLPGDDLPAAFAELHRILRIGGRTSITMFAPAPDAPVGPRGFLEERSDATSGDDLPGRFFTWWDPDALRDVLEAAAFDVDDLRIDPPGPGGGPHPQIHVEATAARRLPDHVGPHMRLLCCGLNPSLHAADAGIGYVSPSNRFWKAALAAGLTDRDRDPAHLLRHHRIGMTDLVRRATPRAAELRPDEYREGVERLRALCERHRPAALAVVGLTGWRSAVDRHARPGWQPEPLGPTPVFLLPSTSGLNAHVTVDDLARALRTALDGPD